MSIDGSSKNVYMENFINVSRLLFLLIMPIMIEKIDEIKKIAPSISEFEDFIKFFSKPMTPFESLMDDDTPEEWMAKIQYRELARFKKFLKRYSSLINDDHFKTDDLVKARALSGVFWVVDENKNTACKAFSGMLTPEQAFGPKSYQVVTCLHGFNAGNQFNNVSYYFVPYGVKANAKNVPHKCFKVNRVTHC